MCSWDISLQLYFKRGSQLSSRFIENIVLSIVSLKQYVLPKNAANDLFEIKKQTKTN